MQKILKCMIVACFATSTAFANAVGPTDVNDRVSFSSSGSHLTIVNTPGSIINWQGFSVGVEELTQLNPQSISSVVLNRVIGVDPSVSGSIDRSVSGLVSTTSTTLGGANTVGSLNASNTTSGNVSLTTTATTQNSASITNTKDTRPLSICP